LRGIAVGYTRSNQGDAMNFRILGSVILIFGVVIYFFFYTEAGRAMVAAAGYGALLR
jgi:hypothetical protein